MLESLVETFVTCYAIDSYAPNGPDAVGLAVEQVGYLLEG